MVQAIKATFDFRLQGNGYSLSFFLNGSPSTNFVTERTKANALAAKLNNVTANECVLTHIRLQNVGTTRSGLVYRTTFEATTGNGFMPLQTSAQIKMQNPTLTKTTSFFMRGLSANTIGTGGRASDLFISRINELVVQLTTDLWGWIGKDDATSKGPTAVQSITQNASLLPVVTFTEPWFVLGDVGSKIVRISLAGVRGADTCNGTWIALVTGLNQVTFRQQVLMQAYVPLSGTGRWNNYQFNAFGSGAWFAFGERKVGRPSYAPRGRKTKKRVLA